MSSNPISWIAFLFFTVGAAGGCLYLYQVIRTGLTVAQPVRRFNPLPQPGLPMAPRFRKPAPAETANAETGTP